MVSDFDFNRAELPHTARCIKLNKQGDLFATPPNRQGINQAAAGCSYHNSKIPLLAGLAHISGFRLKSVGGREQVSFSAALSLRPVYHAGSKELRRSLEQLVRLIRIGCCRGGAPYVAHHAEVCA